MGDPLLEGATHVARTSPSEGLATRGAAGATGAAAITPAALGEAAPVPRALVAVTLTQISVPSGRAPRVQVVAPIVVHWASSVPLVLADHARTVYPVMGDPLLDGATQSTAVVRLSATASVGRAGALGDVAGTPVIRALGAPDPRRFEATTST